jgi:hypothetical protein
VTPFSTFVTQRRAARYDITPTDIWMDEHPEIARQIREALLPVVHGRNFGGQRAVIAWLNAEGIDHPLTRHTLQRWLERQRQG